MSYMIGVQQGQAGCWLLWSVCSEWIEILLALALKREAMEPYRYLTSSRASLSGWRQPLTVFESLFVTVILLASTFFVTVMAESPYCLVDGSYSEQSDALRW